MNDASGNLAMLDIRQFLLERDKAIKQSSPLEDARIEMNLQGTNARSEIENTFQHTRIHGNLYPFHQSMSAKAQIEVKFGWAIFHQHVLVPRLPVYRLQLPIAFRNDVEYGFHCRFRRRRERGGRSPFLW